MLVLCFTVYIYIYIFSSCGKLLWLNKWTKKTRTLGEKIVYRNRELAHADLFLSHIKLHYSCINKCFNGHGNTRTHTHTLVDSARSINHLIAVHYRESGVRYVARSIYSGFNELHDSS